MAGPLQFEKFGPNIVPEKIRNQHIAGTVNELLSRASDKDAGHMDYGSILSGSSMVFATRHGDCVRIYDVTVLKIGRAHV